MPTKGSSAAKVLLWAQKCFERIILCDYVQSSECLLRLLRYCARQPPHVPKTEPYAFFGCSCWLRTLCCWASVKYTFQKIWSRYRTSKPVLVHDLLMSWPLFYMQITCIQTACLFLSSKMRIVVDYSVEPFLGTGHLWGRTNFLEKLTAQQNLFTSAGKSAWYGTSKFMLCEIVLEMNWIILSLFQDMRPD